MKWINLASKHLAALDIICFDQAAVTIRHEEKKLFFTQGMFHPKLFYLKKCVNFDKSEFATKQHEMYLTTRISKTRLPHIYRGKNCVNNLGCFSF